MQQFSVSPRELFASAWRHRALVLALAYREVVGRYRGSVLGMFWAFFHPLLMLVVYTFVFSVVFRARWTPTSDSRTEFAIVLFAGLIVYNLFAECVNRAPTLILNNTNYVKKVVFPIEILPWVVLGSALFHAVISLIVWCIAALLVHGVPPVTIVSLPLVLLPLILLLLGLAWALSGLGVYLRDIAQVVGVATSVLMFLSPLFYPVSSLPQRYQTLLFVNPLTPVIEETRAVMFLGRWPDPLYLVAGSVLGACAACLGFAWFQRSRRGFADVL